jgi:hypothetical protein
MTHAQLIEMEALLQSARCIAQRKGEGTNWERFDASIAKLGISGITARNYRLLPTDDPKWTNCFDCKWEGVPFADKDQTACPKCGSANLDRT